MTVGTKSNGSVWPTLVVNGRLDSEKHVLDPSCWIPNLH